MTDHLQPGDRIGGRFEVQQLVALGVFGRDEKCKDPRCGGSHYHCPNCGAVVSMCGHDEDGCARAREQGLDDPAWVTT